MIARFVLIRPYVILLFGPDMISHNRVQFLHCAADDTNVVHIVGMREIEDLPSHPLAHLAFQHLAQLILTLVFRQLLRCSVSLHHLFLHMNAPAVILRLGKGGRASSNMSVGCFYSMISTSSQNFINNPVYIVHIIFCSVSSRKQNCFKSFGFVDRSITFL